MNCCSGIRSPNIADMKGILKVLWLRGYFCFKILPPLSWIWGTVGEIKG